MSNSKMPDTSIQAYEEKTIDSIKTDWQNIMDALKALGSGMYEDIAIQMQTTDLNVVSRRMKEMRERGMIYNTGEKKKTKRGRWAYVHCITLDGAPKVEIKKRPVKKELTQENKSTTPAETQLPSGAQIAIKF